jgi:hypothetical protein
LTKALGTPSGPSGATLPACIEQMREGFMGEICVDDSANFNAWMLRKMNLPE